MKTIQKGSKGDDVKLLQIALHLYADGIFGELTAEAVREFQKANGLVADGIVGSKTWEKLGISEANATIKKSKRQITEIIIHCSATLEGRDFTVADIRQWHLKRGFSDIGYHYVIYRNGTVHLGRDVDVCGAHCTNHNSKSIGICYIGGCGKSSFEAKDTRTDLQKVAMLKLLKDLKVHYPKATIHGHREFANKACPSFDVQKEYANI